MLHTRTLLLLEKKMEGRDEGERVTNTLAITMPFNFFFKNETNVGKIVSVTLVIDTYFL